MAIILLHQEKVWYNENPQSDGQHNDQLPLPIVWGDHIARQKKQQQTNNNINSLVTRKPVFGISDQVRLKSVCSATEAS